MNHEYLQHQIKMYIKSGMSKTAAVMKVKVVHLHRIDTRIDDAAKKVPECHYAQQGQ